MSDQPSPQFPLQPAASPEDAPNVPADPLADTVTVPAGPSLLGADLPDLAEELRAYDTANHVGLSALLDATPATWIHLPAYRIGRRLVTNGEYRTYLEAADPQNPGARIYDSRALWEYVWQGLGLAVQGRRVPTRGPDGRVGSIEESYHDSRTFVDAYLKSLRRSVERLIQGESLDAVPDGLNEEAKFRQSGEQTMMISVPASPLARGIFDAIDRAVDEGQPLDDGGNLAQRIGQLLRQLEPALRQSRDQRRPDAKPPEPEAMVLLRRAAEALKKGEPLRPSNIIFPREWSSPEGPQGLRFPGPRVAWEDQPVTGITLYEAAGYCAWLSLTSGKQVTLPSEAEWERAASWPFAAGVDGGKGPGDTTQKSLWPWWEASDGSGIKQDFTHFFGHLETGGMEGLYGDKREYRRIVDATTRRCGEDGTIEQLLGFGFQWTSDRFDHRERRYARFSAGRYPQAAADGVDEPVYAYRPVHDARYIDFVIRGAPALIGGPGLTTRRFAACPLRGSRDIGFRIAVQSE